VGHPYISIEDEVLCKKSSPTALLNNSQIYFLPKLTSFVTKNMKSLMPPIATLFNRTNNIVDSNVEVVQSKVLVDPLLGALLEEERKIDPHIFLRLPKNKF
jgi:hypothetical protein